MGYSLVGSVRKSCQHQAFNPIIRYNSAAQYWTYASSTGAFTSPAMKPGTYTMVYYQGEYVVATSSVTVTAGSTTSKSISGSVTTGTTIFRIGDWDGT
jgi:rhamnogalacturonan endolyase